MAFWKLSQQSDEVRPEAVYWRSFNRLSPSMHEFNLKTVLVSFYSALLPWLPQSESKKIGTDTTIAYDQISNDNNEACFGWLQKVAFGILLHTENYCSVSQKRNESILASKRYISLYGEVASWNGVLLLKM